MYVHSQSITVKAEPDTFKAAVLAARVPPETKSHIGSCKLSLELKRSLTVSPTLANDLERFENSSTALNNRGAAVSAVINPDGAVVSVVTVLPVLPAASTATMLYATTPSLSPDTSTYVHVTFPDNT